MNSETLQKADACINGERQDTYGNPEDSFQLIAHYWQDYLSGAHNGRLSMLNAHDVAIMMTLFKIARMSGQKWHPDNAVDACGYLAILNDRLHHTTVCREPIQAEVNTSRPYSAGLE